MGTLTLDNMKDEVRSNLGERGDMESRLTRFINLAQTRIARARNWEELKFLKTADTVYNNDDDDKYISAPANLRKINSLRLIDGTQSRKLEQKTARAFDREIPRPLTDSRDRPRIYIRWGTTLELYPVPDAAYTLVMRGTVWPTDLSADADLSLLDRKDDLIMALATNIAWLSIGRLDDAKIFWAVFANGYKDAVGEDIPDSDLDILQSSGPNDVAIGPAYYADPFVKSIM